MGEGLRPGRIPPRPETSGKQEIPLLRFGDVASASGERPDHGHRSDRDTDRICKRRAATPALKISGSFLKAIATAAITVPVLLYGSLSAVVD
jgi:hypothetical protein